jgi:hypothetical protein
MNSRQTRLAVALGVIGLCASAIATADEAKVRLRVRIGDANEALLTVVDGHRAELKSASLDMAVIPTVSHDRVVLSVTLADADQKVIGTPRLTGQFGQQMKLVLRPESGSAVTVVVTPERIN